MQLSPAVIEMLNHGLGIEGRPHMSERPEGEVDTGCYQWSKSLGVMEAIKTIPPSVAEALQRFYAVTPSDSSENSQKRIDDFFANEPVETQADYARYTSHIQEAYEEYVPPPFQYTCSPQLQAVFDRNQEILSREQEKYFKNDVFDVDAYNARLVELQNAEPPEIEAEWQAIGQQAIDYQRRMRQRSRKKKLSLKHVRALLEGEHAIAYGADIAGEGMPPSSGYRTIVVAPTTDPWDALRIEGTQGNNHPISTEELIAVLKGLDAEYGVDVTGAVRDGVEFTFKRIPKGKEAREVGKRLYEICPDLGEPPAKFPRGRVSLWWD